MVQEFRTAYGKFRELFCKRAAETNVTFDIIANLVCDRGIQPLLFSHFLTQVSEVGEMKHRPTQRKKLTLSSLSTAEDILHIFSGGTPATSKMSSRNFLTRSSSERNPSNQYWRNGSLTKNLNVRKDGHRARCYIL